MLYVIVLDGTISACTDLYSVAMLVAQVLQDMSRDCVEIKDTETGKVCRNYQGRA